jgi:hypothetical protein
MVSNRWANYINQTLAAIKLVTYSIIALAGIVKLIAIPDSRLNWKKSLEGDTDITAYSTSILLVNTVYENICPFFLWIF